MPAKVRYDQETLISAALNIVRKKGMEGLNARSIAQEMGCSTQPIYRALKSMEALRQAVLEKGMAFFEAYIRERCAGQDQPYLRSGLAYLSFAREEAPLFRVLFMRERTLNEQLSAVKDATFDANVRMVSAQLGYSREKALAFHYQSYIFVHGLASMLATGFLRYDEEELRGLLGGQYRALRLAFDDTKEK